jgi:hypothetical protein
VCAKDVRARQASRRAVSGADTVMTTSSLLRHGVKHMRSFVNSTPVLADRDIGLEAYRLKGCYGST